MGDLPCNGSSGSRGNDAKISQCRAQHPVAQSPAANVCWQVSKQYLQGPLGWMILNMCGLCQWAPPLESLLTPAEAPFTAQEQVILAIICIDGSNLSYPLRNWGSNTVGYSMYVAAVQRIQGQ